ncbi:hypothetical protein GCM10007874_58460 [Labrys miyagiensis]|uniref:Uncharacterized protein n=1 Tax=Labrys miyagiensis TaxID=346912 RepID=A0ABQ6CR37_9HYPH|nr:hypothetical protein GCM10007874_58460 [Labrys miyagiensis]
MHAAFAGRTAAPEAKPSISAAAMDDLQPIIALPLRFATIPRFEPLSSRKSTEHRMNVMRNAVLRQKSAGNRWERGRPYDTQVSVGRSALETIRLWEKQDIQVGQNHHHPLLRQHRFKSGRDVRAPRDHALGLTGPLRAAKAEA